MDQGSGDPREGFISFLGLIVSKFAGCSSVRRHSQVIDVHVWYIYVHKAFLSDSYRQICQAYHSV